MEKSNELQPDSITNKVNNEKLLSAAIMLAIDLDSTFKMYSYRCISAEQYTERVKELTQFFTNELH